MEKKLCARPPVQLLVFVLIIVAYVIFKNIGPGNKDPPPLDHIAPIVKS